MACQVHFSRSLSSQHFQESLMLPKQRWQGTSQQRRQHIQCRKHRVL